MLRSGCLLGTLRYYLHVDLEYKNLLCFVFKERFHQSLSRFSSSSHHLLHYKFPHPVTRERGFSNSNY